MNCAAQLQLQSTEQCDQHARLLFKCTAVCALPLQVVALDYPHELGSPRPASCWDAAADICQASCTMMLNFLEQNLMLKIRY